MAAGMNAGGFILRELEPGTRYSFFDFSPYVVSYLNAIAKHKGAEAAAIEADILKLQKPERPLAVLRSKNAVAYVPGFEKKLSEMADWVAPGGRLVLQNDPNSAQRGLIVRNHGPLALRLIEEGWDFKFEFASSRAAEHALDTLILTRPKAEGLRRSTEETRELWERYLAAVKYADAREGF
jgi:SAM-dependent methyltransferase